MQRKRAVWRCSLLLLGAAPACAQFDAEHESGWGLPVSKMYAGVASALLEGRSDGLSCVSKLVILYDDYTSGLRKAVEDFYQIQLDRTKRARSGRPGERLLPNLSDKARVDDEEHAAYQTLLVEDIYPHSAPIPVATMLRSLRKDLGDVAHIKDFLYKAAHRKSSAALLDFVAKAFLWSIAQKIVLCVLPEGDCRLKMHFYDEGLALPFFPSIYSPMICRAAPQDHISGEKKIYDVRPSERFLQGLLGACSYCAAEGELPHISLEEWHKKYCCFRTYYTKIKIVQPPSVFLQGGDRENSESDSDRIRAHTKRRLSSMDSIRCFEGSV